MAAAAIPAIMGISSIVGGISARKNARKMQEIATTLSPEERQAQAGALGQAGSLSNIGSSLYGRGQGPLGQATSYYQTLLGAGGRGAMQSAVAPVAEGISDNYKGVSRALEGANVRGGVRDLALAEAEREKTGRISRLTAGVQPMAASALESIGRYQTSTGIGAKSTGGSLYADLLGQGRQDRALGYNAAVQGNQITSDAGANIGALLFTLLSSQGGGKSGDSRSIGYRGLPVGSG